MDKETSNAVMGFTAASDRQKHDAFIRCGVRLKFYHHNDLTMAELVDELDQTLFTAVLHNDDHVLRYILPDRRHHSYCLRQKRHELTLGAILETSSKDLCLKTCVNIFTYFCNFHRMYLHYPVICCVLPTTQ